MEASTREELFYVKIVHENDDQGTVLNEEDANFVLSFVSKNRSLLKDGKGQSLMHIIKIKRIYFNKGDVIVVCDDQQTKDFVESLNFSEKDEGNPCKVVKDAGRMVLCNIKVLKRPEKYSRNEFKRQIEEGNPGIIVNNLDFERSEECRFNKFETIIYFKVDKGCFEAFAARGYKIYFDCQETEIRSAHAKRDQESNAKKTKLTHIN